jgi:hypothetical protein
MNNSIISSENNIGPNLQVDYLTFTVLFSDYDYFSRLFVKNQWQVVHDQRTCTQEDQWLHRSFKSNTPAQRGKSLMTLSTLVFNSYKSYQLCIRSTHCLEFMSNKILYSAVLQKAKGMSRIDLKRYLRVDFDDNYEIIYQKMNAFAVNQRNHEMNYNIGRLITVIPETIIRERETVSVGLGIRNAQSNYIRFCFYKNKLYVEYEFRKAVPKKLFTLLRAKEPDLAIKILEKRISRITNTLVTHEYTAPIKAWARIYNENLAIKKKSSEKQVVESLIRCQDPTISTMVLYLFLEVKHQQLLYDGGGEDSVINLSLNVSTFLYNMGMQNTTRSRAMLFLIVENLYALDFFSKKSTNSSWTIHRTRILFSYSVAKKGSKLVINLSLNRNFFGVFLLNNKLQDVNIDFLRNLYLKPDKSLYSRSSKYSSIVQFVLTTINETQMDMQLSCRDKHTRLNIESFLNHVLNVCYQEKLFTKPMCYNVSSSCLTLFTKQN